MVFKNLCILVLCTKLALALEGLKSMLSLVLQLEDVGDEIEKIRIGHDGSGFGAAWHLNKVEIRRLKDTGKVRQK